MTNSHKLIAIGIALVAMFVAYRMAALPRPSNSAQPAGAASQALDDDTGVRSTDIGEPRPRSDADLAASLPAEPESDCLNPTQLQSHPMFNSEIARWDPVATTGPTIASYRGLPEPALRDLAVQGDSAAMAVLGAIHIMRARKLPDDQAVAYLLFEDKDLLSYSFSRPLDAETVGNYERARDWFYKAALRGRLMALYHVGDIRGIVEGGPIQLGWIDKDEYDALNSYGKSAILPSNVYNAVAYEIAPQLLSGPMGSIATEFLPRDERQQLIVSELASQFEADRNAAGLPPITVTESTVPAPEDIRSMLCEPFRQEF